MKTARASEGGRHRSAVFGACGACVHVQDYQMWLDLRSLESRVDRRYVTHESDDLRWHRHAHVGGQRPASLYPPREDELETLSERVSEL